MPNAPQDKRCSSSPRVYVGIIPGMVVLDLNTKEIMNRSQGDGICCLNPYSSANGQLFEIVRNLGAFFLHRGNTGWYLVMDEHGRGKIAV